MNLQHTLQHILKWVTVNNDTWKEGSETYYDTLQYHMIQQRQRTSNTDAQEVRAVTWSCNVRVQQTTEPAAIKRCYECARASDCVCVGVCVTSVWKTLIESPNWL